MNTQEAIDKARQFSAATLHEAAGKRGALPSGIKPVSPDFKLCGKVFTVLSPPTDNLWMHKAIYAADPGDILVVDTGGHYENGYWGDVMTFAAMQRNLYGLVIDGCVRDAEQIKQLGFPIFSRGLCIQGTSKDPKAYGALNEIIRIGTVSVMPGDFIYGDQDGIVVLPMNELPEIVNRSIEREEKEAQIRKELTQGSSTLEIYNLQ